MTTPGANTALSNPAPTQPGLGVPRAHRRQAPLAPRSTSTTPSNSWSRRSAPSAASPCTPTTMPGTRSNRTSSPTPRPPTHRLRLRRRQPGDLHHCGPWVVPGGDHAPELRPQRQRLLQRVGQRLRGEVLCLPVPAVAAVMDYEPTPPLETVLELLDLHPGRQRHD